MSRKLSFRLWALVACVAVVVGWQLMPVDRRSTAQEGDAKTESDQDDKSSKRRLPANYGGLNVTDKQRTAIFKVQDRYNSRIDKLEAEIESLKQERDAKCAEVLTDDQRAKLAEAKQVAADVRIQGKVVLGGRAAAGVLVKLTGAVSEEATTDESGRFAFRDLAPGKYKLSASGTVKNSQRSSPEVEVEVAAPPAKASKVTIELE